MEEQDTVVTKRCTKCGVEKPLGEFYKQPRNKDGYQKYCKDCSKNQQKDYYKNNKDKKKNMQKTIAMQSQKKEKNTGEKIETNSLEKENCITKKTEKSCLKNNKKYYIENAERLKQQYKEYRKNNRDRVNSNNAFRRAMKSNATPKWLTKEHRDEMFNLYTERREKSDASGITYNVDHIVPLCSDIVCRLHVPWNLRVITEFDNFSKHNKLPDECDYRYVREVE